MKIGYLIKVLGDHKIMGKNFYEIREDIQV